MKRSPHYHGTSEQNNDWHVVLSTEYHRRCQHPMWLARVWLLPPQLLPPLRPVPTSPLPRLPSSPAPLPPLRPVLSSPPLRQPPPLQIGSGFPSSPLSPTKSIGASTTPAKRQTRVRFRIRRHRRPRRRAVSRESLCLTGCGVEFIKARSGFGDFARCRAAALDFELRQCFAPDSVGSRSYPGTGSGSGSRSRSTDRRALPTCMSPGCSHHSFEAPSHTAGTGSGHPQRPRA